MEKKYKDYLKEYKDNMLEWVEKYGMSYSVLPFWFQEF